MTGGGPGPLRRLGRLATGEAGPGPAWVLAAAALLAAFLATAAPREVTATSTIALDRAVAGLNSSDTGVTATGQWLARGTSPHHLITTADVTDFSAKVARLMRPPVTSPPAQRWGGFATNLEGVSNAAPAAILTLPPAMEVTYRSGLAGHARLISGELPRGTAAATAGSRGSPAPGGSPGPRRAPARTTLPVAVTRAVAATFRLKVGSLVALGPAIHLVVSGIVVPLHPAGPYWTTDPLPTAPLRVGGFSDEHWTAGALIGPGEVTALQAAVSGQFVQGTWFLPVDVHGLTPATLPALLRGMASLSIAQIPSHAGPPGRRGGFVFQSQPVINSSLGGALSSFSAQQAATGVIGSLIVVGLFAVSLILLLICARLAADAWGPELTLLRVRGGSTRQATARTAGRTFLVAGPWVLAGAALAVLAVPADGTPWPWLPGVAVAVAAVGAPALLVAWQHRQARLVTSERDDVAATRRSPRRTVAEATVIILAAGALVTLHVQGGADPLASASPVLAALAASLLVARLYPLPVRSLLRVAARRPGPVGFLGLARAARSRRDAVLPALALVLAMTMAAFAAMVAASVTAGQTAASWQRVGADATVQATGNQVISPAARRAIGAISGITAVTAVYTSSSSGPFAAQLNGGSGPARSVGLAVVDPGSYAALSGHTPWPGFPSALLARGAGGGGRVPVLVSRAAAASLSGALGRAVRAGRHAAGILELDGTRVGVTVQATVGDTSAMPGGGSFVVLPQWAAGRLPSIAGPDLLLATGPSAGTEDFRRAAAAHVPGGQLAVRQGVFRAFRTAPAQSAAERIDLLGIWAAAALTVVALLLGPGASARGRIRLAGRLAALGMATGQARALALTETVPLLTVGILGMLAATVGLALLIGPALNLAVFAAGAGVVPVRPHLAALLLPAAGSIAVALAIAGTQGARAGRRDTAATLRQEEAG